MEILLFRGEDTGAAVGCVPVLQGWGWQGHCQWGCAGHAVWPRLPCLHCCPLGLCSSAPQGVGFSYIHQAVRVVLGIFTQTYWCVRATKMSKNWCTAISILKVAFLKFFSSQVWKPALLGSCYWHFPVKQGFPLKCFSAASNRTVFIDCIPVRHALISSSTFPLGEFYFMYGKISWSKEREAWDREFLGRLGSYLI